MEQKKRMWSALTATVMVLVTSTAFANGRATAAAAAAARMDTSVACVEAWGDSRYGAVGYDHYVHVRNHCERSVECRVWTNVNPERTTLVVEPGGERGALTFRGSPAREFVTHAECRLLL